MARRHEGRVVLCDGERSGRLSGARGLGEHGPLQTPLHTSFQLVWSILRSSLTRTPSPLLLSPPQLALMPP